VRQQYHSRKVGEDRLIWNVNRLLFLVKDLPHKNISLTDIKELDQKYWYEDHEPTCRSVALHSKLIQEADLKYPVILCAEGRVMDGMHRICKALLSDQDSIVAVQFEKTPEPDYKNVDLDQLPYED